MGEGSSAEFLPDIVHAFIRQEYVRIDPKLPEMLEVLTRVGAAECWHKKSTFKVSGTQECTPYLPEVG